MPTRRKATESQTPATTPKKSKNKNGVGGGMGVSQKYTAYVKERPTDFTREEEILRRLLGDSLEDTLQDDDNDYVGKILVLPPLPSDHGVRTRGIDGTPMNHHHHHHHHHSGPGILRRGYEFSIGLLSRGLNLIGFTILFILWGTRRGVELVWRQVPARNSKSNNRFLIFVIIGIIILMISLISPEGGKTILNRLLPPNLRFWEVTTYKIQFQPHKNYNHNNDSDSSSITLTYEDLRKIIETEVRNHLKKSEGEKGVSSSPVGSTEIRNLVSHEVKQIANEYKHVISSEVKREIKHIRTDNPRLRGRDEYILEIIRNEARKVVAEALLVFSQDKLNKPDFALHSGGAKVMSRYTSKTYEKWPAEWYKKVFAYLSGRVVRGKPPVTAISPNTHVGECWPFPGQEGQLAILLNRRVYVNAVTYDHVSRDVAVEVQSAPMNFEVWGIIDEGVGGKGYKHEVNDDLDEEIYMESTDDECSVRQDGEFVPDKNKNQFSKINYSHEDSHLNNDELHIDHLGSSPLHLFLGSFTYNISSLPVQTFDVPQETLNANKPVRMIIMKVINNWGKIGYTCLYRFRVHGNPADKADN